MAFSERLERTDGEGSTKKELIDQLARQACSQLLASPLQSTDSLGLSVPPELVGRMTKEELGQILGKVLSYWRLFLFNEEGDEESIQEEAGNCSAVAEGDKIHLFFTEQACERELPNLDLEQAVFVVYPGVRTSQN